MLTASMGKRLRAERKRGFTLLHEMALRVGLIVLPKHYYVPIPDLRALRRSRPAWARRSALRGVQVDLDAQLESLRELVAPFEAEFRGNAAFRAATAGAFGPGFGYIEAQALHGMVRGLKPHRIIEIGSGVSTFCMIEAARLNEAEGQRVELTCIEPYPSRWLAEAPVCLLRERVEAVALETFDALSPGDMLFVDSTHTVRTGGDVMRIVLEILPRLAPGVIVHFHDIYLPYDFQRDADRSLFQWMETALLHAYLIGNDGVEIVFCLSQLHYDRPEALRSVFPEYRAATDRDGLAVTGGAGHFPSSLYLRIRSPVATAGRTERELTFARPMPGETQVGGWS